ncbi:synaptogyrin-4 [Hemicordylus capensis]|uniref:synaptogyrin-4 n=1 Tax=Hemicordylus capensis TaxID=884348 RepID=UPI002303DFE9|nr:synaptogyrin-4 [Hemicordylus capensis]XP_053121073.1 synaptogyrin-4 [Hemicordylus capensis]XP_053121074.1 synaptogyrin-4 [Hemicordylus capensis]XP_053121075.1 synaptogyrin-4 [Hemicordylus capensis]XP_053121076.1 synaptogyrin-4 [Hemicordylus capensis]
MRKAVSTLRDFSDHDMVQFFIRRQIIARTLAGVFSLIIFASLVTEGYQNLTTSSQLYCVLNDNGTACCYGITVGVLAFLQCLLFLGFDIYDTSITSHRLKYAILILDVTFSIIWTCLWFVGFCFLANQWNRSTHTYLLGTSAAQASITFAFLSIPCWVYLAYLALKNLWAEPPVPYKRTLDEGSVALTTLSSSTTTAIPNNMGYPDNVGPNPYPSTPVPNRLTLMNADD